MRCPKHPKYMAKRKPHARCHWCWFLYIWNNYLINELFREVAYDPDDS